MKQPLRRRGLTLVEVSVSMVIMVILILLTSSLMLAGMNIFWKNAESRAAQSEGNAVFALLSEKISYATQLTISGETADELADDEERIEVTEDGVTITRMYQGQETRQTVFDKAALHGHRAEVTVTQKPEDPSFLTLALSLYSSENELLYTQMGVVPLLNFTLSGQAAFSIGPPPPGDAMSITYQYLE